MIFACIKGTSLCGGWIYVSLLCFRIEIVVGTASHVCILIQLTVFLLLITLLSQAKLIFVLRSNFSCRCFLIRTEGTVHASSTVAVSWSRSCSLSKPMSTPVMYAATQRCSWLLDMVAELCIVITGGPMTVRGNHPISPSTRPVAYSPGHSRDICFEYGLLSST